MQMNLSSRSQGADVVPEGGVRYRTWAPGKEVTVVISSAEGGQRQDRPHDVLGRAAGELVEQPRLESPEPLSKRDDGSGIEGDAHRHGTPALPAAGTETRCTISTPKGGRARTWRARWAIPMRLCESKLLPR